MKTPILLLAFWITSTLCEDCFWSNCQPDNHPQSGCSEYNRYEKAKKICNKGQRFYCCAQGERIDVVNITAVTAYGTLAGVERTSRSGRKYYGFLGVRYARPPKRFEIARPPKRWSGILDAKNFGPMCAQISVPEKQFVGTEDCLFLNVYTPNLFGKLPVMMWIHGGAFIWGSGQKYDAKYIMDEDVVLVTINYRLGSLGFLSTGDSLVPGNLALKDEILALKWIKKNIHSFGGNPDKVTISGESVGGTMVALHMLSPMSKDLFHYGISESGIALMPLIIQTDPAANAKLLGKSLKCCTSNTTALVKCLKRKCYRAIVNAELALRPPLVFGDSVIFSPVVETQTSTQETVFLPDTPYKIAKSGRGNKKPWIVGFDYNEGLFFSTRIVHNETLLADLNDNWYVNAPSLLGYAYTGGTKSNKYSISYKVLKKYFGDKKISLKTWANLTDMITDRYIQGMIKTISIQSAYSPVYAFVMAYKGNFSFSNLFYGVKDANGVGHFDELQYLFNSTYGSNDLEKGTPDGDFSIKFVKLWTSFAKAGKPSNPANPWTQVEPNKNPIKFFRLDKTPMFTKETFDFRAKFWDDLHLAENEYAETF